MEARRIWLNLELAKKPVACLEYILVHEMVHLIERHHSERFRELMDVLMPSWQICRDELNRAPLAHEEWGVLNERGLRFLRHRTRSLHPAGFQPLQLNRSGKVLAEAVDCFHGNVHATRAQGPLIGA